MKGFIFKGPKDIELKELDYPTCGDNDVIIKNLYAGICGSDVGAYMHGGDDVLIFKDHEFGHEMISEVVEVGSNVTDITVGERVYPYPMTVKNDALRAATVGGFTEFIHVPDFKLNHSAFKIPDNISSKEAAMIEPFTVGFHSVKQAEAAPGKKAIVFGAGMIGLAAAIGLKTAGVEKVMVVDVTDSRLELAKELGFEVCNSTTENLKDKANDLMGTLDDTFGSGKVTDVDIYIDATGIAVIPKTYQEMGKSGSVLSVVGIHHDLRELDLRMLVFNEQKIVGSAGYDMDDVRTVIGMMESKNFDLEKLVSHEYKQEDLEEGILMAANSNESLKVMIKY